MRRRWIAAGIAGASWLVSGAINGAFSWNGFLPGSIGAVMPATIPGFVWARPALSALAIALVGAAAVALLHSRITAAASVAGRRTAGLLVAWFAAVAAGALTGLALDVATIVGALPPPRLQMALDGLGTQAAVGAYWGLAQGWLPALLLVDSPSVSPPAASPQTEDPQSRAHRALLLGATVVALLAVVPLGVAGQRAAVTAAAHEQAISSGFDEDSGALPDPYAVGTPVATTAPQPVERDPAWCTPDQAMILLGDSDAATGHRTLSVRLMNFSDTPCGAAGYPDIAFADQNGNALTVDVVPGSSFMATDPGPQPLEIPAGGYAIARLGWDANPTAGALVATTMYGAPFAGDARGSWPISSDIVEDSTVHVTAWELSPPPTSVAP